MLTSMGYSKRNNRHKYKAVKSQLSNLQFLNLNQIARLYCLSTQTLISEIAYCSDKAHPFPKPHHYVKFKARFSAEAVEMWFSDPTRYLKNGKQSSTKHEPKTSIS
jgi:hypothetical protein